MKQELSWMTLGQQIVEVDRVRYNKLKLLLLLKNAKDSGIKMYIVRKLNKLGVKIGKY